MIEQDHNRIRLAHPFDPVLAVHTSLVEPFPQQITAVDEVMLPRPPCRSAPEREAGTVGFALRIHSSPRDYDHLGPAINLLSELTVGSSSQAIWKDAKRLVRRAF